jgi:hypothetical protein
VLTGQASAKSLDGYYSAEQMDAVQSEVDTLCLEVRNVASEFIALPTAKSDRAVPVIDAFALSDHIVNSPLGRYDGAIYEAYFAQVGSGPLHFLTPLTSIVGPSFESSSEGAPLL